MSRWHGYTALLAKEPWAWWPTICSCVGQFLVSSNSLGASYNLPTKLFVPVCCKLRRCIGCDAFRLFSCRGSSSSKQSARWWVPCFLGAAFGMLSPRMLWASVLPSNKLQFSFLALDLLGPRVGPERYLNFEVVRQWFDAKFGSFLREHLHFEACYWCFSSSSAVPWRLGRLGGASLFPSQFGIPSLEASGCAAGRSFCHSQSCNLCLGTVTLDGGSSAVQHELGRGCFSVSYVEFSQSLAAFWPCSSSAFFENCIGGSQGWLYFAYWVGATIQCRCGEEMTSSRQHLTWARASGTPKSNQRSRLSTGLRLSFSALGVAAVGNGFYAKDNGVPETLLGVKKSESVERKPWVLITFQRLWAFRIPKRNQRSRQVAFLGVCFRSACFVATSSYSLPWARAVLATDGSSTGAWRQALWAGRVPGLDEIRGCALVVVAWCSVLALTHRSRPACGVAVWQLFPRSVTAGMSWSPFLNYLWGCWPLERASGCCSIRAILIVWFFQRLSGARWPWNVSCKRQSNCRVLLYHLLFGAFPFFAIDASLVSFLFSPGDHLHLRYSTALHWSLTQFTPAAMEVTATNGAERLFSVCVVLTGAVSKFPNVPLEVVKWSC